MGATGATGPAGPALGNYAEFYIGNFQGTVPASGEVPFTVQYANDGWTVNAPTDNEFTAPATGTYTVYYQLTQANPVPGTVSVFQITVNGVAQPFGRTTLPTSTNATVDSQALLQLIAGQTVAIKLTGAAFDQLTSGHLLLQRTG